MKIYNWIMHWSWVNQMQKVKSSLFKNKNETDAGKSHCILDIFNQIENYWLGVNIVVYKLGIKTIQQIGERTVRVLNIPKLVPEPLFSAGEIASIRNKFWWLLIVLVLLVCGEATFNFLFASLFLPGAEDYLKTCISFLLTGAMLGISYGFTFHFLYHHAVERYNKKEISVHELTKFRHKRNIGYFFTVCSLLTIVGIGMARIYYLEIPPDGLTKIRRLQVEHASVFSSFAIFVFTILLGALAGYFKYELSKVSIKYQVYRRWKKTNIRRNRYSQDAIRYCTKIKLIVSVTIQKHWQIVIDMKRVFMMDTEYDQKYQALNDEYIVLAAQPGFRITEDIYRKYAFIQSAHEELFRYGVMNFESIKEVLDFVENTRKYIESYLASQQNMNTQKPLVYESSNGVHKKETIIINHKKATA